MTAPARIVVVLGTLLLAAPAHGTSITSGFIGAHPTASGATGSRARLELRRVNGVLVARPEHGSLALVAVHAPPAVRHGHLLVREVDVRGGGTSVLLSAPDALAEQVSRITLFVRGDAPGRVLVDQAPAARTRVFRAERLQTPDGPLLAFAIPGTGHYWLGSSGVDPPPPPGVGPRLSAVDLFGGEVERAVRAWHVALLALLIGWGMSRWRHAVERDGRGRA